MGSRPGALFLAAWLCLPGAPAGAAAPARLASEIAARSEAMANLEHLCDGIGARMTGSPALRAAQRWAMVKLAAYGAVNVHEEAYDLGRPWVRGGAQARLLNAGRQQLAVVQKAWTTGTARPLQADVGLLDVKTLDEFRAAAPALRGKIVLVVSAPRPGAAQAKEPARFRQALDRAIAEAGFAAVLLVSGKEGGVLDMWGGPASRFDARAAVVTKEGAALLARLLKRGVTPRLALTLGGGFAKAPVQAYNVVADIAGSALPDEMVIIGAHQDSWDLGTGATDNGAGTVVAMEVLRAMHAAGLQPTRTLRIVLFSGEEQGLLGSKAYVARHRAELGKIQAVLVQDAGGGRIEGFPDMKVDAWNAALTAAVAPVQQLGPLDIAYGVSRGSDHDTFFARGIPAFSPLQDARDYRSHTQHSELDTVDHVAAADLAQGAQVMAAVAWSLLNGERLPHQAPVSP
jgi:carboxypeptidase Q